MRDSPEIRLIQNGHLMPALSRLTPREIIVVLLRSGTMPRTLPEIGLLFDVSRERVRQIEACAIAKIRRAMREQAPPPTPGGAP